MPKPRPKTRCRNVHVNHERQMVYVPVPKAAQRSMRYILRREGFVHSNGGVDSLKDYFKFTVIRNPYNRYVSAHTTARMRYVRKNYVDINVKERAGPRIQKELFKSTEKNNNELWELFVESIDQNEISPQNQHYHPQVYWLRDRNLEPIAIDWYMVLDHLESDLCRLEEVLGLELKRCHDHAAPQCWKDLLFGRLNEHPEYQTRINALYKEDWELYNKWKR